MWGWSLRWSAIKTTTPKPQTGPVFNQASALGLRDEVEEFRKGKVRDRGGNRAVVGVPFHALLSRACATFGL